VRNEHARSPRGHRDGGVLTLATFGPGDVIGELKTIHAVAKEHTAT
jgi:CRP-like cAMP-binding protein